MSASPETAFALFTAHMGNWWPLADKNVLGLGASVAFEDRQLVERSRSARSVWAEVSEWKPPTLLRLDFYPGLGSDHATNLLITFTPTAEGTLVTLEHRGWDRLPGDDSDAARLQVQQGWVEVLDEYRQQVNTEEPAGR